MKQDVKCPKCGHYLVYETYGQYGLVCKVGHNGKIQKKCKRVDYGMSDVFATMVWCPACLWTSDGQFVQDGDTIELMLDEDTVPRHE